MHPVFIAAQSAKGRSGVAKKCAVSKQHLEQPQHIVPCAASKLSLRQPSRRKATNKRVCSLCGCLSSICTTIPRGAFETRQNDAQIVGLFPIRVGIRNGDARQQRSRDSCKWAPYLFVRTKLNTEYKHIISSETCFLVFASKQLVHVSYNDTEQKESVSF